MKIYICVLSKHFLREINLGYFSNYMNFQKDKNLNQQLDNLIIKLSFCSSFHEKLLLVIHNNRSYNVHMYKKIRPRYWKFLYESTKPLIYVKYVLLLPSIRVLLFSSRIPTFSAISLLTFKCVLLMFAKALHPLQFFVIFRMNKYLFNTCCIHKIM